MDAVWTPGVGEWKAASDLVLDAPLANFATTTAAVVHLCCFEEGMCICWDEVEGEGVWEAGSGSTSSLISICLLNPSKENGNPQRILPQGRGIFLQPEHNMAKRGGIH